eukprot:3553886-Pyramimonas_sp.AAC.1
MGREAQKGGLVPVETNLFVGDQTGSMVRGREWKSFVRSGWEQRTKGAHLVVGAAEKAAGSSVEDGIGGSAGGGALLGHFVAQILDDNLVGGLVQDSEAVASDEDRTRARAALGVLRKTRCLS